MSVSSADAVPVARFRLWAEFAAIFAALPLVMALGLPASFVWAGLALMFLCALALLSTTEGFRWRSLAAGPLVADWRVLAGFFAVTCAVVFGLVLWLRPYAFLGLPRFNPELWLIIMIAYPFLSALPQEIVYRALFFNRYGVLFPDVRVAIAVNAAAFSLAHLFYWNWPAIGLTACGGAIFAWAYRQKGSFPFAWLLHALAGQTVFTSGLGVYFYHGAV
jgi:CAAX protease family protein